MSSVGIALPIGVMIERSVAHLRFDRMTAPWSPLPQNLGSFQRHNSAGLEWDHARGVVAGGTGSRDLSGIDVASSQTLQWFTPRHDLANRLASIQRIGVDLDPDGLGIELVQVYLHPK